MPFWNKKKVRGGAIPINRGLHYEPDTFIERVKKELNDQTRGRVKNQNKRTSKKSRDSYGLRTGKKLLEGP